MYTVHALYMYTVHALYMYCTCKVTALSVLCCFALLFV